MRYEYGFTKQEAASISAAEFAPLTKVSDLAKSRGMKSTSLAATLRRLRDKNAIRLEAVFNPFALGVIPVAVYGQLLERSEEDTQRLMSKILAAPHATYVIETLGQYNLYFSILVSSLDKIPCVMKDLFESQGDIFSGKLIAPRLELSIFPKKFLSETKELAPQINCRKTTEAPYVLDVLDRAILEIVCNRGFESFRQVAHSLSEPASTVERRIKRLRKKNVLSGFRYRVNRSVIETQQARLLLSKKGFCSRTNDQVLKFALEHPKVIRCIRAVGAWDYELSLEVCDLGEISTVVSQLHNLCGVRLSHVEVLTELREWLCRPYVLPADLIN